MAGEVRAAMEQLRAARTSMTSSLLKEIADIQTEVKATEADGMDAMKLPRAELEAAKQEIREIRAEFAPTSNGGPPGPLPGTQNVSAPPSGEKQTITASDVGTLAPSDQSAQKKT